MPFISRSPGNTRVELSPPTPGSALLIQPRRSHLPVPKRDGLSSPVIIDSIRVRKKGRDYLIHVRSKDGAEGVSLVNPPRGEYIGPILRKNITPFLMGKDVRDLEDHLWELYRYGD